MIRRPPRSTRTDTPFPTRRSSDLHQRQPAGTAESLDFLTQRMQILARGVDRGIGGIGDWREQLPFDPDCFAEPDVALCKRVAAAGFGIALQQYRIVGAQEQHVGRSEEHTSELQSLMRISYAVFCL